MYRFPTKKGLLIPVFSAIVLSFANSSLGQLLENGEDTSKSTLSSQSRLDERPRRWRWEEGYWEDSRSYELRYNRVEGLFFGLRLPKDYRQGRPGPALYGSVGYGFESKGWRFQLGLERSFFDEFRFLLGGEIHDLTDTEDHWIIPTDENSLAAFLFHEDFQDYFRRTGYSTYVSQNITDYLTLRAEYGQDEYKNMRRTANWSLFGNKKRFRDNPVIDEGKMKSIVGKIIVDSRDRTVAPHRGWYIQLMGEFAGRSLGGDFGFNRYIVDLRRYQPLGFHETLNFRIRIATADALLPDQKLFDLGGISTLRGYRFKEFTGDRALLANVEYHFRPTKDWAWDLWFLDEFDLILFADTGVAWFATNSSDPIQSFQDITLSDLKTNIGIAFSDSDGKVRINFARRTDSSGAPLVVTFRINRPF